MRREAMRRRAMRRRAPLWRSDEETSKRSEQTEEQNYEEMTEKERARSREMRQRGQESDKARSEESGAQRRERDEREMRERRERDERETRETTDATYQVPATCYLAPDSRAPWSVVPAGCQLPPQEYHRLLSQRDCRLTTRDACRLSVLSSLLQVDDAAFNRRCNEGAVVLRCELLEAIDNTRLRLWPKFVVD